jgi:hypothetical protein
VFFVARLRDEQKFARVQDLVDQLKADEAHTRELLKTSPIRAAFKAMRKPLTRGLPA